ncbi:hypothetical protein [Kineococcus sp. SYSU DK002]|uniref:hypothetical protein n=1 Tax=Kineococcus sp. SYSU DK002 TaxID=3383123 RepID=UPI003D7E0756
MSKQADVVLHDLNTLAFTLRQDPSLQLAYSENGSSVDTVVAEQVVVHGGQLTTLDEAALRAELAERMA